MFEQAFNNIDNVLRKDDGCATELDYVEQSSWILFLKYLHDLEQEREINAELEGRTYTPIIKDEFRWDVWAAPKIDGKIDQKNVLVGSDLVDFVNLKLFPYLKSFREEAASPDTIQYKIGEIFSELKNRMTSGYNIRDVVEEIDTLQFQSSEEKHEMSHLYESRINRMGNAGRNGGEYYTPRPLIRTIVRVVNPKIDDTIYDGACGSAGFLCEAFSYLLEKAKTAKDHIKLQKETFYGKEKKGLAYIIGIMNMILHGIQAPNIIHKNTLSEDLFNVEERDKYNIVLANPPFGGKERAEVQQNFPIRTSETSYLFLQHFIRYLKVNGRAGVIIKNTFLSNTDKASIDLRKRLLADCNLYAVLDLPSGVFTGAGVKTVVLFFEKGESTEKVWYYQLNLDRNLGKSNPLNEQDLAEFVTLQPKQKDSENSWTVRVADLDPNTLDLSVKNPNRKDEIELRSPIDIIAEMQEIDNLNNSLLDEIKAML